MQTRALAHTPVSLISFRQILLVIINKFYFYSAIKLSVSLYAANDFFCSGMYLTKANRNIIVGQGQP